MQTGGRDRAEPQRRRGTAGALAQHLGAPEEALPLGGQAAEDPDQGRGVGGIVRDIISMGARPVAVMDQLRFGAVDHPDTARVVHGVVAGVGG